jgi:anti-anti-sigma regulatory factor
MYTTLSIKQSKDKNTITFYVNKINILNVRQLENTIIEIMSDKKDLVLDLANVTFIDSNGFQLLHKIKIESLLNNIDVDYININPELQDLFNLSDDFVL